MIKNLLKFKDIMKTIDKQYTDILDEFFTDSSDLVNKSYYT